MLWKCSTLCPTLPWCASTEVGVSTAAVGANWAWVLITEQNQNHDTSSYIRHPPPTTVNLFGPRRSYGMFLSDLSLHSPPSTRSTFLLNLTFAISLPTITDADPSLTMPPQRSTSNATRQDAYPSSRPSSSKPSTPMSSTAHSSLILRKQLMGESEES